MKGASFFGWMAASAMAFSASSCAKKAQTETWCAPTTLQSVGSSSGQARSFLPDPLISSGMQNLTPASSGNDAFASQVTLEHLTGRGVLEGQFVEVKNLLGCNGEFGSYDPKNQFVYPYGDARFPEAMSYYFGDQYRSYLSGIGYLQPASRITIFAHCAREDNASFLRVGDGGLVCLGDSVTTPGASFGEDGAVTVHELQHGTTVTLYNARPDTELNQFWTDEASALNEAVSDFAALVELDFPTVESLADPMDFSRWALGKFYGKRDAKRGAHRCPTYDSDYPRCSGFSGTDTATRFSAAKNTISYIYPDGLGWPHGNNYPDAVTAFRNYSGQEEIHNAGVLLSGALWDVYQGFKTKYSLATAKDMAMKVVLEAIRRLPAVNINTKALSPVTFRSLASQMITAAGPDALKYSADDQNVISGALAARGLYGVPYIDANWLDVGPGKAASPGVKILDTPITLKEWIFYMTGDPTNMSVVSQTDDSANGKLDPGELAVIWFDLKNLSRVTAGGVLVTVTVNDPYVQFFKPLNIGGISINESQIRYGKVNGLDIAAALPFLAADATHLGNSYFQTNPYFSQDWRTGIWVEVDSSAPRGRVVNFHVRAEPSNGDPALGSSVAEKDFPVTIN